MVRKRIRISGIVQGVGFRPWIYNLARHFDLRGFVLNDSQGVLIEVQGLNGNIVRFLDAITREAPPLAGIEKIESMDVPLEPDSSFEIRQSRSEQNKLTPVSPDAATCQDCQRELFDPGDRRYLYPFINCTNCGPRFTITRDVPYDRINTTMSEFELCPECKREYEDPDNRRFHAQPNACPKCGPQVRLIRADGSVMADSTGAISETIRLLKQGLIVAVKGIGGWHLACDAANEEAVKRLRNRKAREEKPLAVMVRDIESARKIAVLTPMAEKLLASPPRPIVLLEKNPNHGLAYSVSLEFPTFGIMLPYAPLHFLLLQPGMILVMTSGNVSDEPIAYVDDEALSRLGGIADCFLTHNRKIHIRCDDSVVRPFGDSVIFFRRARGYAPTPVELPFEIDVPILGAGAELKNTFCLAKGSHAFVSHHIGDLENLETLRSFEEGVSHFSRIFDVRFRVAAYDLHPRYLSTQYVLGLDPEIVRVPVQHHHAHAGALLAEWGRDEKIIAVAMDGTGLGDDGSIWGGEFLAADLEGYERMAHLKQVPMPGGEAAIKEPWRMSLSHLLAAIEDFPVDSPPVPLPVGESEFRTIKTMIAKKINCPMTSSMGRLFDAVAALLKFRDKVKYEGQAAMELEVSGRGFKTIDAYAFEITETHGKFIVDPAPVIRDIVKDINEKVPAGFISARFHGAVALMIARVVKLIRQRTGINAAGLTGGCFQNFTLLEQTVPILEQEGFEVLVHRKTPPNDGGISLGQTAIAYARTR